MRITIAGYMLDIETAKFITGIFLQLLIALGAWMVAYRIHQGTVSKQNEDLRIRLYDRRYDIYRSFYAFIEHCVYQDIPHLKDVESFDKATERAAFLFGKEITLYGKEILANAVAIVGIQTNLPCVFPPVVGGHRRYFPGSTKLTGIGELHAWFGQQYWSDLEKYFRPYLDFSKAGVNVVEITMTPPVLPEPALVRRKISDKQPDA